MSTSYEILQQYGQKKVRDIIRRGKYIDHTAGLARGFLQVNIVIIEKKFAEDFKNFCQLNPKPCPLVGITEIGSPFFPKLGKNIDIRTDVPSYNVYRNGTLVENRHDILELWKTDMVGFALGCSFTFEDALSRSGIPIWHIINNKTVPMFKTNIATNTAGPFGGPLVVSMRSIKNDKIELAKKISEKYPLAHGSPIHWHDPADIGIQDINKPDWGDPAPVKKDETPVFWACGVTPQVSLMRAKLEMSITHKPGQMLITDLPENSQQ